MPLLGGRLTEGITRLGDTVRRPTKPSSRFVAELLRQLQVRGFSGAPRYLGIDHRGRQQFSYVQGDVARRHDRFTDTQIAAAGKLLRAFHDATRNTALTGVEDIVCHHDAAPHNVVFERGVPVALIDFDMAEPGDPLQDVAFMAWTWCIAAQGERGTLADQARQLRVLADAYGLDQPQRAGLVEAMVDRQRAEAQLLNQRWSDASELAAARPSSTRLIERMRRTWQDLTYTTENHAVLTAALA